MTSLILKNATTELYDFIDIVDNFPQPGIFFYDIQRLLREQLSNTIDLMAELLNEIEWEEIDLIAAIDARGFILASALAYKQGKGIVLVRKKGKLPPPTFSQSYSLEYNDHSQLDVAKGKGKILIVDDVLATGGTLNAAINLCSMAGYNIHSAMILIELPNLLNVSFNNIKIKSLLSF